MTPLHKLEAYRKNNKLSPSERKKIDRMLEMIKSSEKWEARTSQEHHFNPFVKKGLNRAFPGFGEVFGGATNYLLHGMDLQEEGARKLGDKVQDNTSNLPPWLSNILAAGAYTLGSLMGPPGAKLNMVNFHGTPHKWLPEPGFPKGRPRLDKIGTGEGAQAYGWGFYSAGNPDVAKQYQEALRPMTEVSDLNVGGIDVFKGGRMVDYSPHDSSGRQTLESEAKARIQEGLLIKENTLRHLWETEGEESVANYIKAGLRDEIENLKDEYPEIVPEYEKVLARAENSISQRFKKGEAFFNEIDIPDEEVAKYLDWDKPLTGQNKRVKEILKSHGIWKAFRENQSNFESPMNTRGSNGNGEQIYNFLTWKLGGQREASEYLESIGIPGLRYFDGVSRSKGRGSRNYVTWSQDVLNNSVK